MVCQHQCVFHSEFLSIVFPALISQGYCDREPLLLFFPGPGFISSPCGGPLTATQFPRRVPGLFSGAALRSQPGREGTAGGRDRAGLPSPYGYHRPAEDGPAEPRAGQWGERGIYYRVSLWHRSWDSNRDQNLMLGFSPLTRLQSVKWCTVCANK